MPDAAAPRIRRARPEDARFLAWAVLAAARSHRPIGFFDLLVPESEEERLALAAELVLAEKPSWWHWSLFRIAERDGAAVAALAGFDPSRLLPAHAAVPLAAEACGLRGERLAAAFSRVMPLVACMHDPTPGAWVVESVATRPEARGGGLARALVESVLAEGRDGGHAQAQLTLMIGNAPAQRVYESVGFRINAEKRSAAFESALGCPGLAQMTCPL